MAQHINEIAIQAIAEHSVCITCHSRCRRYSQQQCWQRSNPSVQADCAITSPVGASEL